MTSLNEEIRNVRRPAVFSIETLMLCCAVVSGMVLIYQIFVPVRSELVIFLAGVLFTLSLLAVIFMVLDPDSVRARQSDAVLKLARQTLSCVHRGMDQKSAQKICELLLPNSAAVAVGITDTENILGYAGVEEEDNPAGRAIRTKATHDCIEQGETLVLLSPEEIGFPHPGKTIRAAIVAPLRQGRRVFGTLKFYYKSPRHINETQRSIAEGFAQLLSTQLAAVALEEQTKLATSMELKALQAQINPHFLFNTVNTIASFVRTDPDRARVLLREFATFYRHTLEDTGDLVALSREVEQTMRYFYFEVARFGEDKLRLEVGFEDDVNDVLVPAFLIQPLVENAVRHARPTVGMLTIQVKAELKDGFLILSVADDGVGMDEEHRLAILHPESSTGLGIAVKNVHDRVEGYFGPGSHMEVESEVGKGTTVRLIVNLESEHLEHYINKVNEGQDGEKPEKGASNMELAGTSLAEAVDSRIDSGAGYVGASSGYNLGDDYSVARAANAEAVSSAEIRAVENLATQGELSGLTEAMKAALAAMNEEEQRMMDELADADDDDDWDYEAELAAVSEEDLAALEEEAAGLEEKEGSAEAGGAKGEA